MKPIDKKPTNLTKKCVLFIISGLIAGAALTGCMNKERPKTIPVSEQANAAASADQTQTSPAPATADNAKQTKPETNNKAAELIEAVTSGDAGKVKAILDGGTDPNQKDDLGNTALITTAQYGYTEIAKLLLEHGADPNIKDGLGISPLKMATENGYTELADLLRQKGAKE